MIDRLGELETDLLARRSRAENEGWFGEIEGIDLTLAYLQDKRQQGARLSRRVLTGGVRLPGRAAILPFGVRREALRSLDRLKTATRAIDTD